MSHNFKPFKHSSIRNIYHLISSVWLLSIAIASPLLHGYVVSEEVDEDAHTRLVVCSNRGWSTKYRLIYYSTYSLVVYITPLMVMAFTHMKVGISQENLPHQNHTSFYWLPRILRGKDNDLPSILIKVLEEKFNHFQGV